MKKRKTFIRYHKDVNRDLAFVAGHRARLEDKPLHACPNLIPQFGETYAVRLMNAWMEGWHERDKELKMQSRHAMKGAD